jgi:hypothetical protein
MTTPDHRPYLTATDLRTPEDVLAWLDAMALTSSERIAPIQWSMAMAHARLRARLDRERRQACRRAALEEWRAFRRCLSPMWTSDPGAEIQEELWREGNDLSCCWGFKCLALALAFRAAARTP